MHKYIQNDLSAFKYFSIFESKNKKVVLMIYECVFDSFE